MRVSLPSRCTRVGPDGSSVTSPLQPNQITSRRSNAASIAVASPPSLPLRDDPTRFDTMTNRPIQASTGQRFSYHGLLRLLYHRLTLEAVKLRHHNIDNFCTGITPLTVLGASRGTEIPFFVFPSLTIIARRPRS